MQSLTPTLDQNPCSAAHLSGSLSKGLLYPEPQFLHLSNKAGDVRLTDDLTG